MMVDGGTSFRLTTWPSHLIVCLSVYVPCSSMPLYHSPSIGWLHGLMRDTLKQWHYRVIIRNGHLNLRSILTRQRKGLPHMTSIALTTALASTRSQKGVVQRSMVRSGHQGVILWYLVISHADVGKPGSTTFLVLIMLQHLSIATLPTRPRYHGSSVLSAFYIFGLPVLSLS